MSFRLTPADEAVLSVNALDLRLDSSGAVYGIAQPGSNMRLVSDAGVWLAGEQDGEVRAFVRALSRSNYIARAADRRLGVFTLTNDSLAAGRITNWPTEYGAPVRDDGTPLIFGDMMMWSALVPGMHEDVRFRPESLFDTPLAGVNVSQAVFGYSTANLENVVFLRYELTNDTENLLDELYTGFYADVDVDSRGCYSLIGNATGYDAVRALSYTYPRNASGDEDLGCPVRVLGLVVLESPGASTPPEAVTSHAIFRKNVADYPFSEATLRTPEDVLLRLQGLSSDGDPMIDPETGIPTPYAFTGDPVQETGWLDEATDVRSLTTAGPFSLASGESRRLVVAMIAAEGPVLSEAMASLEQQVDLVRSEAERWDFSRPNDRKRSPSRSDI